MGTRYLSLASLREFASVASKRRKAERLFQAPPSLKSLASESAATKPADAAGAVRLSESEGPPMAARLQEGRVPLSDVVKDCMRRWFVDTLSEAKAGDIAMQVLVGQMYQAGYGVPRNEKKAKLWLARASKYRSSVWKVSEKHPGYNASDSDSEEVKNDIS